jgi:hypothetical protein
LGEKELEPNLPLLKRNEMLVEDICNEVGLDRRVLKVWMHKNKNPLRKREGENYTPSIWKNEYDRKHLKDTWLCCFHCVRMRDVKWMAPTVGTPLHLLLEARYKKHLS